MNKSIWKLALSTGFAWSCAGMSYAGGWYHMPTSFCQCMGWGFGPGYHAPLVLGPHGVVPTSQQERIRLQCPPFGVGIGCHAGIGCDECAAGAFAQPCVAQEGVMPTDYPLLDVQTTRDQSSSAPLKWRSFGPPAPTAVGR